MSHLSLPASLQPLAALFLKAGVSIGGLSDAQRRLVLGLVWAGLPSTPMSERDVNGALRARLAGAANFLDTDHVQLRRWLVDTGWLARDGFGREYRRVACADGRDRGRIHQSPRVRLGTPHRCNEGGCGAGKHARCCGSGLTGGAWLTAGTGAPAPHGRIKRMSLQQAYRQKRIAAADAVRQVRNG